MHHTRVRLHRSVQFGLSLALMLSLFLPLGTALADPLFPNDNFKTKWQRADKPVNDGSANPSRSWLWGPDSFNPPAGQTEPYVESPGGNRQVLYFDKARMEINNSSTGAVTNGLLVRELISGKQATGDSAFTQRRAADDIPVAGDPSGNDGPTYASFAKLASLNNDNPASDKTGTPVADTLDKAGMVGSSADLGNKAKYVYFDSSLKHNVPDVFMNFMNQRGNVYVNGQLVVDQPILGDNNLAPWLDANGLPVTEAYWAKVTVAGQVKDVLIQAFERRVLTYTPTNPPAYQVEMGNVGRHYYNWRYSTKYNAPSPTPTPNPTPAPAKDGCDSLPANGTVAYPFVRCGPAGMVILLAIHMNPNETVTGVMTLPNGQTSNIPSFTTKGDGVAIRGLNTFTDSPQGTWTFKFKGQSSGKEATAYFWLDPPVTKPTVIVFPNPGRLDQDITFVVVGFEPLEDVRITVQSPAAGRPSAGLESSTGFGGGITALLSTRNVFPPDELVPGDWTMTVVAMAQPSRNATVVFKLTK